MMFVRGSAFGFRFFCFFVLSVVLMVLDQREPMLPLRSLVNQFAVPLHYAVHMPLVWVQDVFESTRERARLLGENERLKQEELILQARLQRYFALEKENGELRQLLNSSRQLDGRAIAAQMISAILDPFHQTVLLDKGSSVGVYAGQPVLDATGIMGQIIETNRSTSKLMLISDSRSAVPVQNLRTGERAIAAGMGAGESLRLLQVPHTSDVSIGDLWVTSGLDDQYPMGYPVGRVESVEHANTENFASIRILPLAGLHRTRQVLLLWGARSSQQEEKPHA